MDSVGVGVAKTLENQLSTAPCSVVDADSLAEMEDECSVLFGFLVVEDVSSLSELLDDGVGDSFTVLDSDSSSSSEDLLLLPLIVVVVDSSGSSLLDADEEEWCVVVVGVDLLSLDSDNEDE